MLRCGAKVIQIDANAIKNGDPCLGNPGVVAHQLSIIPVQNHKVIHMIAGPFEQMQDGPPGDRLFQLLG